MANCRKLCGYIEAWAHFSPLVGESSPSRLFFFQGHCDSYSFVRNCEVGMVSLKEAFCLGFYGVPFLLLFHDVRLLRC